MLRRAISLVLITLLFSLLIATPVFAAKAEEAEPDPDSRPNLPEKPGGEIEMSHEPGTGPGFTSELSAWLQQGLQSILDLMSLGARRVE